MKPPLGVMPERKWLECRLVDLAAAVFRMGIGGVGYIDEMVRIKLMLERGDVESPETTYGYNRSCRDYQK